MTFDLEELNANIKNFLDIQATYTKSYQKIKDSVERLEKRFNSFKNDVMQILDSTRIMGDSMLVRIQSLEGEIQK